MENQARLSSNKAFGIVFAILFGILGSLAVYKGKDSAIGFLIVSVLFLGVALTFPQLLAPLNRLWMRFGLLLHRIVNPIVMAILFYVVLTPTAIVKRLFGGDVLSKKFEPKAKSYWLERTPPGPKPETMTNQF